MHTRPDWVRRVAAMGPSVGGAEHLVPLDADAIIAAAIASTGLDDFGPPTWEEPFRRVVEALDREAQLHALGRLESKHDLLRHLRTRLLVVAAGEPEDVVAPVFVTGPARSGTSILHELLGEDPALQAPRAHEMVQPFAGAEGTALAECEFDLWADIQPEFAAVHELKATLPEECLWLLAPEFDSGFWATCTSVPSFMAWRAGTDPVPTYQWHKRMLGVLQRGRDPKPWALKSPVHVSRLPAIFAVYPDARVILTHRDPVKTVPSSASAVAEGRWLRSDAVDPLAVGASLQFGLGFMLNALHDVVATLPAGQVANLMYLDLLHDPVGAIEGAYDALGLPFAAELPDRIRRYLAARPQDKYGVHRYSAEGFGLDPAAIRQDFLPYTEAFGVAFE